MEQIGTGFFSGALLKAFAVNSTHARTVPFF
jgi:hypothetical protein